MFKRKTNEVKQSETKTTEQRKTFSLGSLKTVDQLHQGNHLVTVEYAAFGVQQDGTEKLSLKVIDLDNNYMWINTPLTEGFKFKLAQIATATGCGEELDTDKMLKAQLRVFVDWVTDRKGEARLTAVKIEKI